MKIQITLIKEDRSKLTSEISLDDYLAVEELHNVSLLDETLHL